MPCTIILSLNYEPSQYKLDLNLARILGIHTETKANIMNALWIYIKTHKLQVTYNLFPNKKMMFTN